MIKEDVLARYLAALLQGDRRSCRTVIEETLQSGIPANSVYLHLIWPVMGEIERLHTDQPHDRRPVAEQAAPAARQAQEGRGVLRP